MVQVGFNVGFNVGRIPFLLDQLLASQMLLEIFMLDRFHLQILSHGCLLVFCYYL